MPTYIVALLILVLRLVRQILPNGMHGKYRRRQDENVGEWRAKKKSVLRMSGKEYIFISILKGMKQTKRSDRKMSRSKGEK